MAKQMSRPKRWSKAISDALVVLQAERDAWEEEQGEDADAGGEKMTDLAAEAVESALGEISDLKGEYEEWRDNLPEALQSSSLADKLNEVCDCESDFDGDWTFDEAQEALENLDGIDLPLGFGRD